MIEPPRVRVERAEGEIRIVGCDSDGDPFELRLDDDAAEDFLADITAIARSPERRLPPADN